MCWGVSWRVLRSRESAQRVPGSELTEKIVEIFQAHRGVYGSPRFHAVLAEQGIHIGRKRVVRLMRTASVSRHIVSPHARVTTRANPSAKVADNALNREFEAQQPNQKWVADVTYIGTASGWLYLAVVLDLFSRRVVGWAMAATFDEGLVEQALSMALRQRKPGAGLLHHSDRGCQYTSEAYQQIGRAHV